MNSSLLCSSSKFPTNRLHYFFSNEVSYSNTSFNVNFLFNHTRSCMYVNPCSSFIIHELKTQGPQFGVPQIFMNVCYPSYLSAL